MGLRSAWRDDFFGVHLVVSQKARRVGLLPMRRSYCGEVEVNDVAAKFGGAPGYVCFSCINKNRSFF